MRSSKWGKESVQNFSCCQEGEVGAGSWDEFPIKADTLFGADCPVDRGQAGYYSDQADHDIVFYRCYP